MTLKTDTVTLVVSLNNCTFYYRMVDIIAPLTHMQALHIGFSQLSEVMKLSVLASLSK